MAVDWQTISVINLRLAMSKLTLRDLFALVTILALVDHLRLLNEVEWVSEIAVDIEPGPFEREPFRR